MIGLHLTSLIELQLVMKGVVLVDITCMNT